MGTLKNLLRSFVDRAPREYQHDVIKVVLPRDGEIHFARWLHPGETPKTVSQPAVDALRSFLRAGDVAIDIGAHTGDSTMPIALAVGPAGRVFALEPNPYVFKVLEINARLNPDKTRITPLMFAAMPDDGEFEFTYTDAGYCNGGYHQGSRLKHGHFSRLRVTGKNVLEYLRREAPGELARLRYLKVDTEGYDRAVIASMRDLLASRRPYLKSEIYKHLPADERRAYFRDLRDLGYRVFKCEETEYRGQPLAAEDLERWRHFDIFAVPEERL
jgi:FkbM family methyltransferase